MCGGRTRSDRLQADSLAEPQKQPWGQTRRVSYDDPVESLAKLPLKETARQSDVDGV
jgi:hypothetical protein